MEHVNTADELKAPVVFDGVSCRHFVGPDYEAWFDAATGLPRGFRSGDATLVYRFPPVAAVILQMPPEFQAAWERNLENMKKAGLK